MSEDVIRLRPFIIEGIAFAFILFVNQASYSGFSMAWRFLEQGGWCTNGTGSFLLETLIHPHRLNSIHLCSRYSQPFVSKRRKRKKCITSST
jgi:hypothetical protein